MVSENAAYSARAIATEISAGRLSPDEVFAEHQKAIDEHEDDICAFTDRNEKLNAGEGPLRGISIGVKDIFDTRDMPTTYGSPIYEGHQPPADASLVAMLHSAGATIAGKTETTEFAWFNPAKPATRTISAIHRAGLHPGQRLVLRQGSFQPQSAVKPVVPSFGLPHFVVLQATSQAFACFLQLA